MPQTKNPKRLRILLWMAIVVITMIVVAQILFSQRIKKVLSQEIPNQITLAYGTLSTNVLLGKVTLGHVSVQTKNGTTNLQASSIQMNGLNYWDLLVEGDIAMAELNLKKPVFSYLNKPKDTVIPAKNTPKKEFRIASLTIQDGQFEVYKTDGDSVSISLKGVDLSVGNLLYNGSTATKKIPFTFGDYTLNTQKGYYDLGPLEYLQWQKFQLSPTEGLAQGVTLRSKYNRQELSKKLAVEHDHYNLVIDSILIKQPSIGFKNEELKFHLAELHLLHPFFQIYRNKMLPDDTSHKKMYSQALRDLPIDFQVDMIQISEGRLTYEEKLEAATNPESLKFESISAQIQNLHSKGGGMVAIIAQSQLMGDGQLTLDWSFDPQSKSNDFLATGSLKNFKAGNINPFLKTNLQAEVNGTIDQMYFTISGNELESQGDMKMAYDNFEFVVLKKDRLGVNKFLTSVVNLFTNEGNKTDADGFRHGHFKVERHTDKSFFNYLWLNIKEGLVDTMTGKGKKRNR